MHDERSCSVPRLEVGRAEAAAALRVQAEALTHQLEQDVWATWRVTPGSRSRDWVRNHPANSRLRGTRPLRPIF
jgi:hypothetical protein